MVVGVVEAELLLAVVEVVVLPGVIVVVSEVDDSLVGRGESSFTGCFKENVVKVPPLLPYGCEDDSSFMG